MSYQKPYSSAHNSKLRNKLDRIKVTKRAKVDDFNRYKITYKLERDKKLIRVYEREPSINLIKKPRIYQKRNIKPRVVKSRSKYR